MVTEEDLRAMAVEDRPEKLFDVTGVIGSVYRHDGAMNGWHPDPRQAAMLIIAEHGAEGEYKFPDEQSGKIWTVTVGLDPMQGDTL